MNRSGICKFNVWRENMKIIDKIKQIEKYICENFEEWDLEDPVEEEYLDDFFPKDPRVEASIGIPLSNQYLISCEYETSALYYAINYALQHPKTITHSLVC